MRVFHPVTLMPGDSYAFKTLNGSPSEMSAGVDATSRIDFADLEFIPASDETWRWTPEGRKSNPKLVDRMRIYSSISSH